MAVAPLKPWEMMGSVPSGLTPYIPNTNRLHSSAIPFPGGGGGGLATINQNNPSTISAPPLPPRPNQTRPIYSAYNRSSMMTPYASSYSPMGAFGSPYSSPYGSYGSYGGYASGPFGRSPYGFGQMGSMGAEPSFSQIAEESASPAFQSIESFVGAFCSVSAMLESTFYALYSSFRAVVGVADHLGKVKQILTTLTIFKFLRWVIRRFLYLIGISKIKPADVESLWKTLATDATSNNSGDISDLLQAEGQTTSSWPIFMFLGFIFAGPYLMWKLIKSLNLDPSRKDDRKWATGESLHFVAVAEYPFYPNSDRELELKPGQTIRLAPAKIQPSDVKGWVLASDGSKIGLVPTNYIKIKGKRTRDPFPLNQQQQSLTSATAPSSVNSSPERRVFQQQPGNSAVPITQEKTTLQTNNSLNASQNSLDMSSSDDDTDTLVGEPVGNDGID